MSDKINKNFVVGIVMNIRIFATLLCLVPGLGFAASRGDAARVGVNRASNAAARMPTLTAPVNGNASKSVTSTAVTEEVEEEVQETPKDDGAENDSPVPNGDCREAYRACMDEFCLLDESEGYRCACSSNIEKSKSLIQEIQKIQEEADKLYTEGVEREQLGAKAKLVFGESEAAKKSSRASGLSFSEWLNNDYGDEEELDTDV